MTKYEAGEDSHLDAVATALANGRRRAAVARLCRGPATTTQLAAHIGAALPTTHQHLEVLREAGLVHSSKHGRTVTHSIDVAPLAVMEEWIAVRRSFWTKQLDALATALEDSE
jgi:DNA-binding transcriptional ArsR family regulator